MHPLQPLRGQSVVTELRAAKPADPGAWGQGRCACAHSGEGRARWHPRARSVALGQLLFPSSARRGSLGRPPPPARWPGIFPSLFLHPSRALLVQVLPPNPVLAAPWVPASAPRSAVSSPFLGRFGLLCGRRWAPSIAARPLRRDSALPPPHPPGLVSPAPQLWSVCLAPALPRSLTLRLGSCLSPRPRAASGSVLSIPLPPPAARPPCPLPGSAPPASAPLLPQVAPAGAEGPPAGPPLVPAFPARGSVRSRTEETPSLTSARRGRQQQQQQQQEQERQREPGPARRGRAARGRGARSSHGALRPLDSALRGSGASCGSQRPAGPAPGPGPGLRPGPSPSGGGLGPHVCLGAPGAPGERRLRHLAPTPAICQPRRGCALRTHTARARPALLPPPPFPPLRSPPPAPSPRRPGLGNKRAGERFKRPDIPGCSVDAPPAL